MNGNCYFAEGLNPAVTCNKNEGNRIAIPVLTPDRDKRQNGRRFKTDGEPAFTLNTQDRHSVAVEIEPVEMSGYEMTESSDEAHALNCSDQRKTIGKNQKKTMVSYEVKEDNQVAIGIDDLYMNRPIRYYDESSPTLRRDRQGVKVAVDVETVGYNTTAKVGGGRQM